MSTTVRTTATSRVPMHPTRKTALVAGIFYVIPFVSMPTLVLYNSVKSKDFIISSGSNTGALLGCLLEVVVALAGIGTAVTLYPVVKRQNAGMALGFVASRTLEGTMIFTGVASLLSLVSLHQSLGTATGANATSLVTIGASHIATYNWAFTLGQSLMPGINALLLGTLMYRSGLVPRVLPVIGLIDRIGSVAALAALPIAVWEFSLGVYLIVKGFKPCPITDELRAASTPPAYRDVNA